MKIIEQAHEIISFPEGLLQTIEAAGRTCYKSEDKIGCTLNEEENCILYGNSIYNPVLKNCQNENCTQHSSRKFVKMLRDRGHHAMIEFGDIIVRFVTNRGVTHELVRHRLFSFAQESTRYVRYDGEMEFIKPVWLEDSTAKQAALWADAMLRTEDIYRRLLLETGWRPEQAREVLPNSLKTEIVVKGNIREWRHCLTLRTSKKAHPQMRALMLPLLAELKERLPVVFEDIAND